MRPCRRSSRRVSDRRVPETRTQHPRLSSGTSDAVVAEVLNAPAHPYCRAAGPTSITPSRMNTLLASLSQIRSGAGGSVRYTQAEKAAYWEFVCNRNGITVRMLKRNNPARGSLRALMVHAGQRLRRLLPVSRSHSSRRRPVNTRHAYTSHTRPPGGSSCRGHPASPGRGGLTSGETPERRAL
jgi:hypothetical protein